MAHKMKIRIDDKLWKLMKKYPEIDYNKVMIAGVKDKLQELETKKLKRKRSTGRTAEERSKNR